MKHSAGLGFTQRLPIARRPRHHQRGATVSLRQIRANVLGNDRRGQEPIALLYDQSLIAVERLESVANGAGHMEATSARTG